MPASETTPLPNQGPSGGGTEFDDLDDLFNYDVGDENDPFSDNYKPENRKDPIKEAANNGSRSGATLGIDKEVEVLKKPRAPRVKLDEHRLLSAAGIPKLRKKAHNHLKFKGKGHEYSDAARLLAFYQLWLDDLFPKARFLDALAMVEKTGHKKQMQSMRMEWINEGRPRPSVHDDSIFNDPTPPPRENGEREKTASRVAPIFEKTASERPKTPVRDADAGGDDDLYDATPRPARQTQGAADSQVSLFGGQSGVSEPTGGEEPDEPDDMLDMLLAEEEMQAKAGGSKPASTENKAPQPPEDGFEDDMEAMAEMDDLW